MTRVFRIRFMFVIWSDIAHNYKLPA